MNRIDGSNNQQIVGRSRYRYSAYRKRAMATPRSARLNEVEFNDTIAVKSDRQLTASLSR